MTASSRLGLTPNMVARPKQITKEKGQLCTLNVGREKEKKKNANNRSPTTIQP